VSKRLIRYNSLSIIKDKFPEICDKKVNIVLDNGNVFFVTLIALKQNDLYVSDMRNQKLKFALGNISEIILDFN